MTSPTPKNPHAIVRRGRPPPAGAGLYEALMRSPSLLAERRCPCSPNRPSRSQALRLDAFATAWQAQQQDPALSAVAFDERLGLLVEAEWLARENKRLQTALREAKLRLGQACVEDLDYAPRRELDRALVRQLATCRWVAEHQNVLITGATGTGKTYIACALAQQACRKGYRALYRRVPRLFEVLTLAHADGSYIRLLARFARADV